MEYTPKEKQALEILGRTDFKNLSKTDVLSFTSMLTDMRPEVAIKVLEQFPEFANLVASSLGEYREMINAVVSSDDESLRQVYNLSEHEMTSIDESDMRFHDLASRVQADLSRCLSEGNPSPDERREIYEREIEILRMAKENAENLRTQQRSVTHEAHQKDSEKRHFNWKLLGGISAAVITVIGIGASLLGGRKD